MRIAVIGTGIAGNVAAYKLSKEHDVTVYEANNYVGGHTNTHDVTFRGRSYAIDTGFIVYNYRTYPEFTRLLDELNVEVQATNMSFSVKHELTGLEYNGNTINSLFAQRSNLFKPSFLSMVKDILRFNREAVRSLEHEDAELPLGEYLVKHGYGEAFKNHYIIPMGAAIWSTDAQLMQTFPARFFIRFFHNHGLLSVNDRPVWHVIKGGSRNYLGPLVSSFKQNIRLNAPVRKIRRFSDHVEIESAVYGIEVYDAVFIATHTNAALRMLDDATAAETAVLGAIPYQRNEAVLHTDASLLPKRRLAWAAWNYHILKQQRDKVALTYNMNILQGIDAPVTFNVTLNNTQAIAEDSILKTVQYEHPLFTPDSVKAQARHAEINGTQRTWYCGAYWRNGFHEDGVVSALDAVEHFNETMYEELYLRRAS
ncbi:MAG: FAD-dependent oxidoreductase [Gammaproteobacteria bacterium]|nr:FAD-dependent oxidoreductase [Gammaproteobacteria bacterium]